MIYQRFGQIIGFFALLCCFCVSALAQEAQRPLAPEFATGTQEKRAAFGQKFMAVTAHPDATKAAYDILKKGGTAADAGIAAQMVLGLVEPQSSGLGSGGFVLYYDAKKNHLITLDGRETAPEAAGSHLFMNEDGKPMKFYEAAIGGRSVGVPGLLRMLEKLHAWQGQLPWADLFDPAIRLASEGFEVSVRLSKMLEKEKKRFEVDTTAKLYFYPDAITPLRAEDKKQNPDYAITLRQMAQHGVDDFYEGEIAKNIIAKLQENSTSRGLMTLEDMASYRTKERQAVCGSYRGYKICSMGEPSSGGLTLLSTLGMLEHFNLASWGGDNPKSWHVISEASRLAFADRNKYMADPDFVKTPGARLIDPTYLKKRAALIDPDKAMLQVSAGTPSGWKKNVKRAPDPSIKPPGTTHLSIVDLYGNILSMTSSIENAFGGRLMSNGFLLNNQLTDFSFLPHDENGKPIANKVEGGKRPRSSMTPTIVFDPHGDPFMVIGSAGGSRIIGYVLQRIIAVIDWQMDIQSALDMPHILHRGKKLEVEETGVEFAPALKNFGHPVLVGEMNSGLTAIRFKDGMLFGAADSRRDGVAMGK
ncbi:MAG: gamma-glutamyltransferase [Alphaproteobacteria bacterium]|nr:gamma-glutamyltransferase [Alphaproteobacteria bacterium]